MSTITPRIASEFAEAVYQARARNRQGEYVIPLSPHVSKSFQLNRDNGLVTKGETGGFFGFYTKESGFAIVGEGTGHYRNDTVIAIRGSKTDKDFLTNFDVGIATTTNNQSVHSGFHETFSSMRPTLEKKLTTRLRNTHNGHSIHCIGHSLGGALASLIADWVKSQYGSTVNLYTFGAPRVGLEGYAQRSTSQIDRHFRCTHGADPIPLVPVWPFRHAPTEQPTEYRLDSAEGINWSAHKMGSDGTPGYRNSSMVDDWGALKKQSIRFLNQPIRLRYEDRLQVSFTNYWSEKLNAALITLLKDAGYYSVIAGQATMSSALTFYDRLARSLEKIADASTEFAEQTAGLLGHMLVFAGKAAVTVKKLTYQFIRWVFETTIGALNRCVKQALDSL